MPQDINNMPQGDQLNAPASVGATSESADTAQIDAVFLQLARDNYNSSQDFYQTSLQPTWQRNAAHWNNQHEPGSKYHGEAYAKRSSLFRPVVRTSERTSSAAAAVALFSTKEMLSVKARDASSEEKQYGATVVKHMLEYRLKHDLNWYLTALGAWQDSRVYGPCVSYVAWDFQRRQHDGKMLRDNLVIDLVAPEFLRIDPASDWRDPIRTSPYVIRIVPMYVEDVISRMNADTDHAWIKYQESEIRSAGSTTDQLYDAVRKAREGNNRLDSQDTQNHEQSYNTVYCHENFVRVDGEEYVYWTLGIHKMLSRPVPLESVYPHGRRPLVYGYSVIEAHKVSPNSTSELISDLQKFTNDISNQRIDNVRLALNKRYIIKRGAQVDLAALARNVPGGSVLTDNPERDVTVINTPDVTSSSYAEQERLQLEANELTGTFSGATVQANRALNETVGGMQMLSDGANQLQEFDLKTWVNTWVDKTLELAMLNIQYFETDENVIRLAGEQALQKFPRLQQQPPSMDALWLQPIDLEVDVGFGATSPTQRINNLTQAIGAVTQLVPDFGAQLKFDAISHEIFGAAGYGDGSRFVKTPDELAQEQANMPPPPPTPEEVKLQIAQMQLQGQMQLKQMELDYNLQMSQLSQQHAMDLALMKLSADENKTVAQLRNIMDIATLNDKTKRDTEAVRASMTQNEMVLKQKYGTGI